jgi:hypothetical protein
LASDKKTNKSLWFFLLQSKGKEVSLDLLRTHAFYKSDEEGVGARWGIQGI